MKLFFDDTLLKVATVEVQGAHRHETEAQGALAGAARSREKE